MMMENENMYQMWKGNISNDSTCSLVKLRDIEQEQQFHTVEMA